MCWLLYDRITCAKCTITTLHRQYLPLAHPCRNATIIADSLSQIAPFSNTPGPSQLYGPSPPSASNANLPGYPYCQPLLGEMMRMSVPAVMAHEDDRTVWCGRCVERELVREEARRSRGPSGRYTARSRQGQSTRGGQEQGQGGEYAAAVAAAALAVPVPTASTTAPAAPASSAPAAPELPWDQCPFWGNYWGV